MISALWAVGQYEKKKSEATEILKYATFLGGFLKLFWPKN